VDLTHSPDDVAESVAELIQSTPEFHEQQERALLVRCTQQIFMTYTLESGRYQSWMQANTTWTHTDDELVKKSTFK